MLNLPGSEAVRQEKLRAILAEKKKGQQMLPLGYPALN
jgi:hypothetical protein